MDIQSVATQMAVLFLLVVAGFASRKLKLMDEDFDRKLSNFVIQLSAPCLIISSTMGDTMPDRSRIVPLLVVGCITYAVLITAAGLLSRALPVTREERGLYSFMIAYANVGFIGYPIVASIFGQSSVFYACILNVPNTLTIFVWGVMFVRGKSAGRFDWRLLICPSMVATYLSVAIVCAGWRAPQFLAQSVTLLGNITVPASLLVIGSSIAGMPLRRMAGCRATYMMCALRLVVVPVGMFYLIRLLGFDAHTAAVNAVLVGMPVASFGTMFCIKYGRDVTRMAQGTFLSTLLSMLSIPLLAMLLR